MKKDNGRGLVALARKGRGGDTEIGHLTEGELVVPVPVLDRFPEARDALFDAFREAGIDPERYIVGAPENSVNPETGVREFKYGADTNEGGNSGYSDGVGPRDLDQEPDRGGFPSFGGGQMTLPPEYADFILEDGRRLEDVLGKSFFKGFGKDGKNSVRARVLAERRAQAKRLNQTGSILTSAKGVAGAASTSRNELSGG